MPEAADRDAARLLRLVASDLWPAVRVLDVGEDDRLSCCGEVREAL
jgi:hypothetical protein